MTRTIYKYPITIADYVGFELPIGAEILTVQLQQEKACLWVLLDPNAGLEKRHFRWYGTGHPVTDEGMYVGTVQANGGALVFHLFEVSL